MRIKVSASCDIMQKMLKKCSWFQQWTVNSDVMML